MGKRTILVLVTLCWYAVVLAQPLKVFYVPHSHQDTGWLKTIDQYFEPYDDGEGHIVGGVKAVYDTLVPALAADPERKFIIVEILYFEKWWQQTSEASKETIRKLLANGQIEFVSGGWCMNDEASTTYSAALEQIAFGHQWLWDQFGVRPKYSWQVDPFGASTITPSLFAMMGFQGHLISRIDYQLKARLENERALQFVWRGIDGIDSKRQEIFTHIMDYYSYCTPYVSPGVYFDNPWAMPPVNASNIRAIADFLAENMRLRATFFRTNSLLYPWGCDFQFHDAKIMFENMDIVLKFMQQQPEYSDLEIRYALLSEYFESVQSADLTWSVRGQADFFPYASKNDSFWTGYFSSRTFLKSLGRKAETFLRHAQTLMGLVPTLESLPILRQSEAYLAEFQHHDGITGTHEIEVEAMFESHLMSSIRGTQQIAIKMLQELSHDYTLSLIDSAISPGEDGTAITVIVRNSLAWTRRLLVRISTSTPYWQVMDADGRFVRCQVNPARDEHDIIGAYDVLFHADVPAAGYSSYGLTESRDPQSNMTCAIAVVKNIINKDDITIQNSFFSVTVNGVTGLLHSVTDKVAGTTVPIQQQYLEYKSFTDQSSGKCSGWYIFRSANDSGAEPLDQQTEQTQLTLLEGPILSEIRQKFSSSHRQSIDVIHDHDDEAAPWIGVRHNIGPVLVDRELIVRYTTAAINSNGVFYTDAQGKTIIKRIKNNQQSLNITGNYYPMTSAAVLRDEDRNIQLTLLSDASHGCSSLNNGQLEIMLHRRPSQDDNGGGSRSPMNDDSIYTAVFWLRVGLPSKDIENRWRQNALLLNHPPILARSHTSTSWAMWRTRFVSTWSPLVVPFDPQVHMLSLNVKNDGSTYIRVENLDETMPSNVSLDVFVNRTLSHVDERTLSATASRKDADDGRASFGFRTELQGIVNDYEDRKLDVVVAPQDIRTFNLYF